MNTYQLEVRATCPVDPQIKDWYSVTVESMDRILVEDIVAIFAAMTKGAIFQEDLTRQVAAALGAKTIIVGFHSGVKCTTIAP